MASTPVSTRLACGDAMVLRWNEATGKSGMVGKNGAVVREERSSKKRVWSAEAGILASSRSMDLPQLFSPRPPGLTVTSVRAGWQGEDPVVGGVGLGFRAHKPRSSWEAVAPSAKERGKAGRRGSTSMTVEGG